MESLTIAGKKVTKHRVKKWLLQHRDITASGCWEWKIQGGYRTEKAGTYRRRPNTRILGKRFPVTHLAAWVWLDFDFLDRGPLQVNHHCDNYRCFSPKRGHMYVGTQAENIADMHRRGRWKPPKPVRGEDAHGAKLTEKDVKKIVAMREHGLTYAAIAQRVGIGTVEVWRICNGKRWAWLTQIERRRPSS